MCTIETAPSSKMFLISNPSVGDHFNAGSFFICSTVNHPRWIFWESSFVRSIVLTTWLTNCSSPGSKAFWEYCAAKNAFACLNHMDGCHILNSMFTNMYYTHRPAHVSVLDHKVLKMFCFPVMC